MRAEQTVVVRWTLAYGLIARAHCRRLVLHNDITPRQCAALWSVRPADWRLYHAEGRDETRLTFFLLDLNWLFSGSHPRLRKNCQVVTAFFLRRINLRSWIYSNMVDDSRVEIPVFKYLIYFIINFF